MSTVPYHPDSNARLDTVERCVDPIVRVHDLACIELEGPEFDKAKAFFGAFGLQLAEELSDELHFSAEAGAPVAVVYRRASSARFVGPSFAVREYSDLERLAGRLADVDVVALDLPGAPSGVSLRDPNGLEVKVAYFEDWRELPDCSDTSSVNRGSNRQRVNLTRRQPRLPSRVLRLGHMVLGTPAWESSARFYIDTLGLIPSDVQALPDGRPSVAFLRCDRGEDPADHHTFVVARLPLLDLEHAAFETPDLDDVGMGGRILSERGFKRAWGIGRHILGSQIFDYWYGPDGYKFEHFTDGDLFDSHQPTGYHGMSAVGLSQWGPQLPAAFLRPRLSVREVLRLVKAIFGRTPFGFLELRLIKNSLGSSSLPD